MDNTFTPMGYKAEYYVQDKYIGIKPWTHSFKPHSTGYESRMEFTAKQDFKVGKRWIRKGETYWTMMIPVCGKMVKA
jgi:hypothetical protein